MASALAILLPVAAHAQSGNDSKNRLMFDPSGLQGADSRSTRPMSPPSPTTGQSSTSRHTEPPPASRTATPQPVPQPAAKRAPVPKPPTRTGTATPERPPAARSASANTTTDRAPAGTARTSERPIPREQPGALGRLDLQGGSLGYESQTQMKAYDMGDGRRVPGYDNIQRNDSSYFGLSLRMPTTTSGSSIFGRHGAD